MENEVPLMNVDGGMVTMVKIPEGQDLPQVICWHRRYFVLQNGGFIETTVFMADD